ncbi:MAG: AlpA family phage regulatory protein [Alphaproteobacteria bacterium]|nr:AlpA family phage regulatory protein [Alphaproteobacteria bacterium]
MPKPEVLVRAGGVSEMTVWRWVKAGTFPRPIKIGAHRVGWLESEFLAWLAARAAERDRAA